MVGITTYIKTTLQGNVKFSPPPVMGSKRKQSGKGLDIGRYTDHLFRKLVAKTAALDPSNFKHRRCRYAFDVLRDQKINVTQTQVPVKIPSPRIDTLLDGLGLNRHGAPCVIELKTTQYTLAEHDQRYRLACRKRPRLANGLVNSEHTVHALQAAFGMLALRRQYPDSNVPIVGVVVVAAADGARLYNVDPLLCNLALFPVPSHSAGRVPRVIQFAPWPKHDALRHLQRCLGAKGFTQFLPNTNDALKCSGLALQGPVNHPTAVAVVGVFHQPKPTPKQLRALQQTLHRDTTVLQSQYPHCPLRALVLLPKKNGFTIRRAPAA